MVRYRTLIAGVNLWTRSFRTPFLSLYIGKRTGDRDLGCRALNPLGGRELLPSHGGQSSMRIERVRASCRESGGKEAMPRDSIRVYPSRYRCTERTDCSLVRMMRIDISCATPITKFRVDGRFDRYGSPYGLIKSDSASIPMTSDDPSPDFGSI
ncbi:hypothetical protein NL676_023685 [Syzygium grande]|nr:hypothetical protein NL676_023685 [Syzygium grande]